MGNTLTIFDLDNTLIQGDSSTVWSQFMVREGLATQKGYLAREARLMADYDRGEMNIADYVALIQAPLAGIPKSDVDALVARCRAKGKGVLGPIVPPTAENLRTMVDRGYSMVICGNDMWHFQNALHAMMNGPIAEARRHYGL